MFRCRKIVYLLAFVLLQPGLKAYNIDSLKAVLKNAKHDTIACKTMSVLIETTEDNEWPGYAEQLSKFCEEKLKGNQGKLTSFYKKYLANAYQSTGYSNRLNGNYPQALEYYAKAWKIQEEIGEKKAMAVSIFNSGAVYQVQNNNEKALEFFLKALEVYKETDDKKGLAETYFSIGSLCDFSGDIPKALDYYSKSLSAAEADGNKKVIAYALNNIGSIYGNLNDYAHAIEYYNKSLKLYEGNKDKIGVSISLNNIGNLYKHKGDLTTALDCYERGLVIAESIENKKETANSLMNMGSLYIDLMNEPDKALSCFKKSLKLLEEIGNKKGIANSLCGLGKVYLKKKNYSKAEENTERSLKLGQEIGYPQTILNASRILYEIYETENKPDKALQMYKVSVQMRDSLNNIQSQKASIKREFQYNYEKKAAADSVANAKEKEVKQAQINQQQAEIKAKRNQQYALYGGLILVLIFAVFMYNRFKVTQKQKIIIEEQEKETRQQKQLVEEQRDLIEEKHKEITDSINYAERIQRSFLASENLLDENISPSGKDGYFVFFQPKDVVSGDFYWAAKLNDGNFAYVTADSTGHGVPGAIMSILNISSLEKAIEKVSNSSSILNETRKTIINRLKKDGSADGGKDGMDCSLIVLDRNKKQLTYASANNAIWIVRENTLLEFAPDKMPVGKHDKDQISFTEHIIELQTDDVVYTFTDGFPDQFGGEKNKKFLYKQLKQLLVSISSLPMQQQKEKLSQTLNKWKGATEQTDDVTVIGVRI
ncbi:MAG: protein serine/threonine phosphatase [Bacteroidetes bacterium]|jgi:serine phosphatase RsbU (regulator of sigma subunit)|nr:protein serine/threonine phosphatase [Bacteroidota bacterium]